MKKKSLCSFLFSHPFRNVVFSSTFSCAGQGCRDHHVDNDAKKKVLPVAVPGEKHLMEGELSVDVSLDHIHPSLQGRCRIKFLRKRFEGKGKELYWQSCPKIGVSRYMLLLSASNSPLKRRGYSLQEWQQEQWRSQWEAWVPPPPYIDSE